MKKNLVAALVVSLAFLTVGCSTVPSSSAPSDGPDTSIAVLNNGATVECLVTYTPGNELVVLECIESSYVAPTGAEYIADTHAVTKHLNNGATIECIAIATAGQTGIDVECMEDSYKVK